MADSILMIVSICAALNSQQAVKTLSSECRHHVIPVSGRESQYASPPAVAAAKICDEKRSERIRTITPLLNHGEELIIQCLPEIKIDGKPIGGERMKR